MLVLDTCRGFGRWSSTSLRSGRMTVEESGRSKGKEAESADKFPAGMRVLAVDDDPICLKLLENLLLHCHYDVLSANGDTKAVMEGITHGACDYLLKPIRIEELKNIWQHVVGRKKFDSRYQNKGESTLKAQLPNSEGVQGPFDHSGKLNRKRKGQMEEDEVHSEKKKHENEDLSPEKKPRIVWSFELHRKFVAAVNQLGIDGAVPKKILGLMNVENLTRENVASHLQARLSFSINC